MDNLYCKHGHLKKDPSKNRCHTCHNESNRRAREAKKLGHVLKRGIGLELRLKEKYYIDSLSGCWIWTGCKNSDNCYGSIYCSEKDKMISSHRASYALYKGEIPEGLEVDHICSNTLCCNPEHLEVVTHAENVYRGKAGMSSTLASIKTTHCKYGHEYTEDNTYTTALVNRHGESRFKRRCKTCSRVRAKKPLDSLPQLW